MTEQADLITPQASEEAPASIFDLLRRRHPAGEWAFLEEVAPATGGGTRYADAIAINLWQSRGHAVHGFEVKVSRSDWLRELKQPEKAEPVFRYCDHWWLVAEKNIVKDGELPHTWGHLERRGNGLHTVKAAPRLEAAPLTRAFFASLVRRGHEVLERRAAALVADKLAEMRREFERTRAGDIARATRRDTERDERVARFEKETGLSICDYDVNSSIQAIKLAQRIQALQGWHGNGALAKLVDLAEDLERAAKTVRKAITDTGLIPEGEMTK